MARYVVACHLLKYDAGSVSTSITQHWMYADNEDEARGIALRRAVEIKPSYAVYEALVMNIDEVFKDE